MPKVSVIIPTFNRAEYLPEAINSVLNQTYSDFEIIVVDDGSSDNTKTILEEQFGEKLVYLSKPNSGPASARNFGLSAARGEYIAFLDSDDLWLPDKLAIQIQFMDQHPGIGLSFTWALTFSETRSRGRYDLDLLAFREEPSLRLLLTHNFIPTLTVILRKQCLERAGLFDERIRVSGEDYDLWIRIAVHYNIACLPMVLARYRLSKDSLTGGISVSSPFDSYLMVIREIDRQHPRLIEDHFQNKRLFFADRYREAADLIPFRSGNLGRKSELYMKALVFYRGSLSVLRKLALCYLFRAIGTMKKAAA